MSQWGDCLKLVSGVLASVVTLLAFLGALWNRWKVWVNGDNAKKANPELLTSYIELYAKLPTYVPARDALLATIQEMTLDIAEDPPRITRRREYRYQLYSMVFGAAWLAAGLYLFNFGFVYDEVFLQILAGLMLLNGLMYILVLPFAMAATSVREAARIKEKRAMFMKTRAWPYRLESDKNTSFRSRIAQLFDRSTKREQSQTASEDQ